LALTAEKLPKGMQQSKDSVSVVRFVCSLNLGC